MSQILRAALIGAAGLALVGSPSALAQQPSAQQPASTPEAKAAQLMTASAKVEKVDLSKHELTLKLESGKPLTVDVPESVNRLDKVKKGDTVKLSYYESVALSLLKPGEAPVGEQETAAAETTPGKLPGGMAGEQITTTAKITKLDKAKDEVTIETPSGGKDTIRVKDEQNRAALQKLKVGDEIQATYTQAMAVSVTPKPT